MSGIGPALAGRMDNSLDLPILAPVATADPYLAPSRETQWIAGAVFDTLLHSAGTGTELSPGLATSWRWVDARTLELELRRGVSFHDGSPFDADDVVYTIDFVSRFKRNRLPLPGRFSWLAGAKKLGAHKVRIRLRRPHPAALQELALNLPMLPADYHGRLKEAGDFGRRPIGTGPYKATGGDGDRLTLVRFGGHWQGSPKGGARIARIHVDSAEDERAKADALLDGRADFIGPVDADRARLLADEPSVAVTRGESLGLAYLLIDAADHGETPRLTARPEVRRAIAHAIDRGALARAYGAPDAAAAPAAFCHPAQFGCPSDAPAHAFDPELARALIREARLTDDVDLTIATFGRYGPLAEATAELIRGARINVRVAHMTIAEFAKRRGEGTLGAVIAEWGGGGMMDAGVTAALFFGGLGSDLTGDPALAASVKAAEATTDPARRAARLARVFRRAAEEAYVVPLYRIAPAYGHAHGLRFQADYLPGLPPLHTFRWD